MTAFEYQTIATVLGIAALVALGVALGYLFWAIVGWRGPHRNRRLLRMAGFGGVCVALIASIYATFFWGFMPGLHRRTREQMLVARERAREGTSLVEAGETAPSFAIQTADGQQFLLDKLRGKIVLLNFFATWCGPCLQELPHIQEIWERNQHRDDFVLLVVGREETTESVMAFRQEHGYSFPIACDPERTVFGLFAKQFIPRTYLIGPDGKIIFATTGFDDEEFEALKSELAKQLNAKR
jgi:peroxiredoxin